MTVLSDGLRDNVAAKVGAAALDTVHVIPNFVDTDVIRPAAADDAVPRRARHRRRAGRAVRRQRRLLAVARAGRRSGRARMPDVTFLINGDGSARPALERDAAGLANVRFAGYQPASRLAEVLATGDVHVVPLRAGLGDVSVPSKTYSILAAGRPVVASIDLDSEIPRLLADAGAGIAVAPDDPAALVAALRSVLDDPARRGGDGQRPAGAGPSVRRRRRRWVPPTTSCCARSSPGAAG